MKKIVKIDWERLKGLAIQQVYYQDDTDGLGIYVPESKVHYLPCGSVLLGLENDVCILIELDIERDGITPYEVDPSVMHQFFKIHLKADPVWSQISNPTIRDVILYPGHYYRGHSEKQHARKDTKIQIISSVELVFQHGEKIFISTAEFTPEGNIEQSLFDLIVYRNRKTGSSNNLIPEIKPE